MTDTPEQSQLRAEITEWIDSRLSLMIADIEDDRTLPAVVDFYLIVATEDVTDKDSDTYYTVVTSGCSHYRKVGLLKCAMAMLLSNDD